MSVPRATAFVAALAGSAVLLVAGCYWLRYHDLVETHVELMEQLAKDAGDSLAEGGPGLRAADIARMRYPLERAQQFAEVSRRRFGERASLDRFTAFVAAYERLVSELEYARLGDASEASIRRSEGLVGEVVAAAGQVREAVGAER